MLQVNSSTYSSIPGTCKPTSNIHTLINLLTSLSDVIHASCPSVGSSAEVDLQAVCGSYFSTPGVFL